jgi:hypothetical protein
MANHSFTHHRTTDLEPSRIFVRDIAYVGDRAEGLVAVVRDGLPAALAQVRAWHPGYADASDAALHDGAFTVDDARLVYARQHGFTGWAELTACLHSLPDHPEGEPFLLAFEAIERREFARAAELLDAHPELVQARGTNGNTLLDLACSLAPFPRPSRCRAPFDGDRLTTVRDLIRRGASALSRNDRGWTALHQAGYRDDPEMASLLLTAGASVHAEAHGSGGTPLAVALFWGIATLPTYLPRSPLLPAICASPPHWAVSMSCRRASTGTERSPTRRERVEASTVRTAAIRRGNRAMTARRSSTRPWCRRRSAAGPMRCRCCWRAARASMPIPIAGRRSRGLRRTVARTRWSGCSTMAQTSISAGRSAGRHMGKA